MDESIYVNQLKILFYTSTIIKLNQVCSFINLFHIFSISNLCLTNLTNEFSLKKGKFINLTSLENTEIYFFNSYIKKKIK